MNARVVENLLKTILVGNQSCRVLVMGDYEQSQSAVRFARDKRGLKQAKPAKTGKKQRIGCICLAPFVGPMKMTGIDEISLEAGLFHFLEKRLPVNACALHDDHRRIALLDPGYECGTIGKRTCHRQILLMRLTVVAGICTADDFFKTGNELVFMNVNSNAAGVDCR